LKTARILALLVASALLAACDSGTSSNEDCTVDSTYHPVIDPGNFVAGVNNLYWPLVPNTRFSFQGGSETNEVTVTDQTRKILGVDCVVVHDTVTEAGEVREDTYDWYAQDKDGNVWYMGEDTKELNNGNVVGTEGSWEAGVDGAQPGIVMYAALPDSGMPYRQEYYPCEAEDMAEIVGAGITVTVPLGSFAGCLQIREFTPLEAGVAEYKYYAPGLGLVLEVDVNTGARTELTAINTP